MKGRKAIIRDNGVTLRNCTLLYNQVNDIGKSALAEINQTAKDTIELLKYQEADKRCSDCKYVKVSSSDPAVREYRCYRPLQSKHANPTYASTVEPDWYCKDWKGFGM